MKVDGPGSPGRPDVERRRSTSPGRLDVERRRNASPDDAERLRAHWRRNLRLTSVLLAIWFVVTFVMAWFARDLSFNFFGWPFAFYMGAQGALIVYLLLVGYYAYAMNRLDRRYGVDEGDEQ